MLLIKENSKEENISFKIIARFNFNNYQLTKYYMTTDIQKKWMHKTFFFLNKIYAIKSTSFYTYQVVFILCKLWSWLTLVIFISEKSIMNISRWTGMSENNFYQMLLTHLYLIFRMLSDMQITTTRQNDLKKAFIFKTLIWL